MKFSTKILYIAGSIVSASILICILWFFPRWQSAAYMERFPPEVLQELKPAERVQLEKNAAEIENSNRVTIAQIVGGLALLSGLYFTYLNVRTAQDNLRITEEGKLTERFSKAVELLGSDKLDVRLGGIYALERIARDSQKDHWAVMEVLTAFVRENSHRKLVAEIDQEQKNAVTTDRGKDVSEAENGKPREDIHAIITVIGKREWRATEKQSLNLQGLYLSKFNLSGLDLSNANLSETNLSRTNLSRTILSGTNLCEADLFSADLFSADLRNANLSEANLSEANLNEADLSGADLSESSLLKSKLINTNLKSAILYKANLSRANLDRANLYSANLREAYLSWTNLSGANLYSANLSEANLYSANLSKTDLYHADLRGIKNFSIGQLRLAKNYYVAFFSSELVKELFDKK